MNNVFASLWKTQFPGCSPLMYYIKENKSLSVKRYHYFEDGKRYTSNTSEMADVTRLVNDLVETRIQSDEPYYLILTGYSFRENPYQDYPQLGTMNYVLRPFCHGDEDEGSRFYFFVSDEIWKRHSQDKLIELIANDEIRDVILASQDLNFLCHPYDGGVDIVIKQK